MAFEIRPLREFTVRPSLPEPLKRLPELAHNLVWSWDHEIRSAFRLLDPELWNASLNPVLMLNQLSQKTLEEAATHSRYLNRYRLACDRLDAYRKRPAHAAAPGMQIAYFSMEFGLTDCLTIYSGGLGILAGDHLKSASDLGIPLVGVGLLYQKGYFSQALNPDGWQLERLPVNDFFNLPVSPVLRADGTELKVEVALPGGPLQIKVWRAIVGKVTLYLLDTNIPENGKQEMRDITDQLYGGEIDLRIQQEIVLGVGGLRALRAMGMRPTVFHMNEGHSAFLAVERLRIMMTTHGLSFREALDAVRASNVFTTHTPVAAGIDLFDEGKLWDYFAVYCREAGMTGEQFFSLGRRNANDASEKFSMAILAMMTSNYRNAVSRLHGEVSRKMWAGLWPSLPAPEVPITHVTNGVHLPTFLNGDLAKIYENYMPIDWRDHYDDPRVWDSLSYVPDHELWEAHRRRKRRLITYVRQRQVASAVRRKAASGELKRLEEVLDPDAFTIGFARRFATYKRATLLFHDVERLKRIINNRQRPVQIIVAGKAHPKDLPGKCFIREVFQFTRDPDLQTRVVFVEDYSIQVAKEMVQGVDLWLNNPRRGEEACATSGMKAAINGVPNLSILDGWFDEAYEGSGCWAIGDREAYSEDQDEIHSSSIYSLLETEILPMYFQRNESGVPTGWMARVKQCLKSISPQFNAQRMVEEYFTRLYTPAHNGYVRMHADSYSEAKKVAAWERQIVHSWDRIRFVSTGDGFDASATSGQPISLSATLDLAGLGPGDVRVEAVIGPINSDGIVERAEVAHLLPNGREGNAHRFALDYVPRQTGRLGYSVRVSPNHFEDPLTRPCNPLVKWGE